MQQALGELWFGGCLDGLGECVCRPWIVSLVRNTVQVILKVQQNETHAVIVGFQAKTCKRMVEGLVAKVGFVYELVRGDNKMNTGRPGTVDSCAQDSLSRCVFVL